MSKAKTTKNPLWRGTRVFRTMDVPAAWLRHYLGQTDHHDRDVRVLEAAIEAKAAPRRQQQQGRADRVSEAELRAAIERIVATKAAKANANAIWNRLRDESIRVSRARVEKALAAPRPSLDELVARFDALWARDIAELPKAQERAKAARRVGLQLEQLVARAMIDHDDPREVQAFILRRHHLQATLREVTRVMRRIDPESCHVT